MSEPTPRPWTRGGIGFPLDPEKRTECLYGPLEQPCHQSGPCVAVLAGSSSSADAELIARCVNAHDDLVAALNLTLAKVQQYMTFLDNQHSADLQEAIKTADAAITKAKEVKPF